MSQQLKLSLPYEIIEKVANRSFLRDNFKRGNRETYHIPEELIMEREGFNDRIIYDGLEELKDSLIANGLLDPLVVDVLPDGRVFVDEGYRRIRGIRMAKKENPHLFITVECFVNGSDITELQRAIRVHASNFCREILKPVERANNAYKIKYCFGSEKSNEEVSKLLGNVSRQTIDSLIKIATAPDAIKNEILMADMNMTEAIKYLNNHKKSKKDAEKAELEANKNTAGKIPLPVDINAKELQELKDLEETDNTETVFELPDDEPEEEKRISTYNPDEAKSSEPLNLVGNTVAKEKSAKKEDDGTVDYDESRNEIAQIQNCIKLADQIEARFNKIDCIDDGTKKDISDWVKWMQKDLAEIRTWIHKNKKQNKIR